MIRKNDETGKEESRVNSFKRFSELSSSGKGAKPKESPAKPVMPETEDDRPMNPNLPYTKGKMEKPADTKYMMPNSEIQDEEGYIDRTGYTGPGTDSNSSNESTDVKFYGKVAKLPKGVKASKGYNFLENVKVSKSSIWYLMVEKQDNVNGQSLQMVKYNHKKGVDLSKFIGDLKGYYISKYNTNTKVVKMIEAIEIDGNDKYSWIKNIPLVEVEGKKMISKITEDLIKLLSK